MSQLFSTELLPPSDRIDAWQWNAQQICGDCRIRLPKTSFHGAIEVRHVAGLTMTRFQSSSLSFWKSPFEMASPDHRCCIVITQLYGTRRYEQDGKNLLLSPGDSTLIDSGQPWSSACESECARLYFRVPWWMMQDRLRLREIPVAQRIRGNDRTGAALFRLSQSMYEKAPRIHAGKAALDVYFQVLSACFHTVPALSGPAPRLRIEQFVRQNLADPELGPAKIAGAARISVRHLHRLFAGSGTTLGDSIRDQRLENCRIDLANPFLRHKSITEIAFAWGFSDSSHFSHAFRRRFGMGPRSYRMGIALADRRMCEDDATPAGRSRIRLN